MKPALSVMDVYDTGGKVRPEHNPQRFHQGCYSDTHHSGIRGLTATVGNVPPPDDYHGFLFPGRHGRGHMLADSASWLLRGACKRGHRRCQHTPFRRTALTQMNAGIPLRIIQGVATAL